MRGQVSLLHLHGAANIRRIKVSARSERSDRLHIPGRRHLIHILAGEDNRVSDILSINCRHHGLDVDRLAYGTGLQAPSMVTVVLAGTSTDCFTVANPCMVNVTVYVPGRTSTTA